MKKEKTFNVEGEKMNIRSEKVDFKSHNVFEIK